MDVMISSAVRISGAPAIAKPQPDGGILGDSVLIRSKGGGGEGGRRGG